MAKWALRLSLRVLWCFRCFWNLWLGAFAVILIAILSKSKSFYIAGLEPLFPTFAIIAHYIELWTLSVRTSHNSPIWFLVLNSSCRLFSECLFLLCPFWHCQNTLVVSTDLGYRGTCLVNCLVLLSWSIGITTKLVISPLLMSCICKLKTYSRTANHRKLVNFLRQY